MSDIGLADGGTADRRPVHAWQRLRRRPVRICMTDPARGANMVRVLGSVVGIVFLIGLLVVIGVFALIF